MRRNFEAPGEVSKSSSNSPSSCWRINLNSLLPLCKLGLLAIRGESSGGRERSELVGASKGRCYGQSGAWMVRMVGRAGKCTRDLQVSHYVGGSLAPRSCAMDGDRSEQADTRSPFRFLLAVAMTTELELAPPRPPGRPARARYLQQRRQQQQPGRQVATQRCRIGTCQRCR